MSLISSSRIENNMTKNSVRHREEMMNSRKNSIDSKSKVKRKKKYRNRKYRRNIRSVSMTLSLKSKATLKKISLRLKETSSSKTTGWKVKLTYKNRS